MGSEAMETLHNQCLLALIDRGRAVLSFILSLFSIFVDMGLLYLFQLSYAKNFLMGEKGNEIFLWRGELENLLHFHPTVSLRHWLDICNFGCPSSEPLPAYMENPLSVMLRGRSFLQLQNPAGTRSSCLPPSGFLGQKPWTKLSHLDIPIKNFDTSGSKDKIQEWIRHPSDIDISGDYVSVSWAQLQ